MGGAATVRELRDLARRYSPSIMCVVETQLHKNRVERLSRSLGFDHGFAISSSSRSGGLGLFWKDGIKIEVLPYSRYHLDAIVSEQGLEDWRLTVVYGDAQVTQDVGYAQVYTFL
jgi:hypothetical protein